MEYILRCNDLKCRQQLHDRAVVTTCSHIFCAQCADISGLSRAHSANRQCPACGTQLANPDDVVVQGLNPSEDYKTSLLSGLNPTVITEVASRGLAFYSYQASQEMCIYQDHLAKSLTDKYATLNQQMDQLVHDANSQIKALQEKIQALQAEQNNLEHKNSELQNALREKSIAHTKTQKLYQNLKANLMGNTVAQAAVDEAENAIHTVRADRYIDKIPGTRTGTANFNQMGIPQQQMGGRQRNRSTGSRSSRSGGQPQGCINLNPAWNQIQGQGLPGRGYTSQSAPMGPPSEQTQGLRSRLPILGGGRQNAYSAADNDVSYQPPPIQRPQQHRTLGGFGFGTKGSNKASGTTSGLPR